MSFLSCKEKEDNTINNITFLYTGSLKQVTIDIQRTIDHKDAYVSVYTKPSVDGYELSKSKIDTGFYITINSFNKLTRLMPSLEKINVDEAFERGFDGYTYKIEFGAKGKNQSYVFWCPNSETKKRGLIDFINVSNEIIKTANLKKDSIF